MNPMVLQRMVNLFLKINESDWTVLKQGVGGTVVKKEWGEFRVLITLGSRGEFVGVSVGKR